jgi:orotidine-5'-phosphate decarboxylase
MSRQTSPQPPRHPERQGLPAAQPANFGDRLEEALERVRHPSLVGIDPHPDLLPAEYAVARDARATPEERSRAVEAFALALIDVVAERVAAIKPQSAFFELFGSHGVAAFERVVAQGRARGLLVIGDVKRGDIASTAAAYAAAFLESPPAPCDAITIQPYLGVDSLEPFVEASKRTGRGLFVLVRTSNPGSAVFQLHGDPPLFELVAREVTRLGASVMGERGYSALGAVVGATKAADLARLRALLPRAPLLLPGYGAQGAGARDVVAAFPDARRPWSGALVNSSRGIAFAWREDPAARSWKDATSRALDRMIQDLRGALGIRA